MPERALDNVELFEKRVAEYERENMEIKEHYAGITKWLEVRSSSASYLDSLLTSLRHQVPSDKAVETTFPILSSMVAKFGFM